MNISMQIIRRHTIGRQIMSFPGENLKRYFFTDLINPPRTQVLAIETQSGFHPPSTLRLVSVNRTQLVHTSALQSLHSKLKVQIEILFSSWVPHSDRWAPNNLLERKCNIKRLLKKPCFRHRSLFFQTIDNIDSKCGIQGIQKAA